MTAATGFTVPTDLSDSTGNSFLYLDASALKYYAVTNPTAHGLSDATAASNLTALTWTGDSTVGTSGEEHSYEVKWDPSQLPELTAGESVDLTIYFVVTDPSA